MLNKTFLLAITLLTSNILPCTTEIKPISYIDYELCNDLGFGISDEYPLDSNSNVAMTTKLVKEDNDDLVFYIYDPRGNFEYSSNNTYKISLFYHNKKIDPDTWTSNIGFKADLVEVTYGGCSSNGTITKFIAPDYALNNNVDFSLFRSYLVNYLYENDYQYVLKDHFVLSPIGENGKSDVQYTQSNVLTLSDVTVVGWAIDNTYPSWWDRFLGQSTYEKQIFYFYGFNIENFENIEQIYNISIEYNLYENGLYFTTSPYVDSWINRHVYAEAVLSRTVNEELNYDDSILVTDKGYANSYDYKTYKLDKITSVKDMLQENSANTAFTTFMGDKLSDCTYVCQFANFEYFTDQVNATESWVDQHRDKPSSEGGGGSSGTIRSGADDNKLANWIYENRDFIEKKWVLIQGTTYFFYSNSCPEVKDVNAIQMKFKSDGLVYDLLVKSQPVDEVPPGDVGEDPEKPGEQEKSILEIIEEIIDWLNENWSYLIIIVVIIILLILLPYLGPVLKGLWFIIKIIFKIIGFILNFALSLITYPFRLIFGHKEFFLWKY